MFGLGAATRIYVATGYTDMRLGFPVCMASLLVVFSRIRRAAICFIFEPST